MSVKNLYGCVFRFIGIGKKISFTSYSEYYFQTSHHLGSQYHIFIQLN